jgi:hypothetical protein
VAFAPIVMLAAATSALVLQQPAVQNGRIETRPVSSIARDLVALGGGAQPVWVAWQVPMIDGDRNLCSTWGDGFTSIRAEFLEGRQPGSDAPSSGGPVRLEAGTNIVVLARVVNGQLDRLRTIGGDCPIDAGGRTVYWLTGVTPAASVQYLESLAEQAPQSVGPTRRHVDSAVSAITYHADASATAALERFAAKQADTTLRRQAVSGLASTRGAYGFDHVMALIRAETNRDLRAAFVSSLGNSPQPAAVTALLQFARTDTDAHVRAEAAVRYVRRAGAAGLTNAVTLLEADADDNVKRRVVSAIATLPGVVASPALIQLARSSPSLVVRKEAVASLGRSKEPEAMAFVEGLLAR